MKNKIETDLQILNRINDLIVTNRKFLDRRFGRLGERTFLSIYGRYDSSCYYAYRDLFFYVLTKEPSFGRFYDRFASPNGVDSGSKKPLAWGPRYWPDMICDVIYDLDMSVETKVKKIMELYKKCKKAEKAESKFF